MHAIEAPRKRKKRPEVKERKWTDIELKQFAIVLADDKSEFALTLETLALKKSANIHIFEQVKKELDARLLEGKDKEEDLLKKGKQRPINTSIQKLRVKYQPASLLQCPVFIPVALNSQTFNASACLRRLLV